MNHEKMQRVTKQAPCPVCGKPDWCGVARNGTFAVCMRVSEGAIKATRNGGYLHALLDKAERSWQPRVRVLERFNPLNRQFDKLASKYTAEADIVLVASRTMCSCGYGSTCLVKPRTKGVAGRCGNTRPSRTIQETL